MKSDSIYLKQPESNSLIRFIGNNDTIQQELSLEFESYDIFSLFQFSEDGYISSYYKLVQRRAWDNSVKELTGELKCSISNISGITEEGKVTETIVCYQKRNSQNFYIELIAVEKSIKEAKVYSIGPEGLSQEFPELVMSRE